MNHFNILKKMNADREPEGPHPVEMELSAVACEPGGFGETFTTWFEVEILRGETERLPDGSTRYRFELDTEKCELLRQALTTAFFMPTAN